MMADGSAGIGAKAQGLIELRAAYGDLVPEFVVLPLASILDGPLPATLDVNDAAVVASVSAVRVDSSLLAQALGAAGQWPLVAVRTSAMTEDGSQQSFAGLYETVLDVTPDGVTEAVERCVRSLLSDRVLAYARAEGLDQVALGGSMVVQRMIHAPLHGVMFTQTGRGELEIAYSEAGPDAVVRGEDARVFRLPQVEPLPRGRRASRRVPVPRRLLEIGRELQARRGATDVEFAASASQVWLLQARPVTAHDRTWTLNWDSSNIGENYPGVTLPLTYSFIRGVYAEVYPAFFRLLGRSAAALREQQRTFRNTLGYVYGRVHYQIDNWFDMAAMLPGGKANQEFFAAMLQPVKEGQARSRPRPSGWGAVALVAGMVRLGWLLLTSERRSRRFARRFHERYARYRSIDFDALAPDAALASLDHIRTDLLALWATPIVNDVRLMVAHGLLRRTFPEAAHADYLAFMTGLTDRASIAPLQGLARLGATLRGRAVIPAGPYDDDTREMLDGYLRTFGGRAPDELQLENPRLGDDLGTLVTLALHAADAPDTIFAQSQERPRGSVRQRLLGHHVRRAIDHRERFRFHRAQVFGIARDAYVSVGRSLAEAGAIAHEADVFWLTVEEVDAAVFGHAWGTDLTGVVASRQKLLSRYEAQSPGRRIVGSGVVAPLGLRADAEVAPGAVAGVGVAPGHMTGEVVVLREFDATTDVRGKVLVTSHVDPGWTLLLVAAGGIVTERGNALSHVAIIGRELGIPVVVGATGAVTAFQSGQKVTMNGTTGQVSVDE